MKADYEIVPFTSSNEWRQWLNKHHADTDGVWLQLYKKASGTASVTYAEALDEALCYGWIDGQKKTYDTLSYLQKFTPRRKNSMWSKRNIEHVARLTALGQMTAPGLAEVDRAKADGRWEGAYDSPSTMAIPDEFLTELAKYSKAKSYFETLSKSDKYAIAWRLQTARTIETRRKREQRIMALLKAGKKLHETKN